MLNISDDGCSPGETCHWFPIRCKWHVVTGAPILQTALSTDKSWFHYCWHLPWHLSGNAEVGVPLQKTWLFHVYLSRYILFSQFPATAQFINIVGVCVCVLQGSSAPVIRRLKETMASWTRSRLCGGSVRTLASSVEIPTASLCSVLGSEHLVSAF